MKQKGLSYYERKAQAARDVETYHTQQVTKKEICRRIMLKYGLGAKFVNEHIELLE